MDICIVIFVRIPQFGGFFMYGVNIFLGKIFSLAFCFLGIQSKSKLFIFSVPTFHSESMLPPHVYFDEAIFQKELELLFRGGPGYVGHAGTVPKIGDYHTLKQEYNGRMLVHNRAGIELISNICRHRQAIIQKGDGNTKHITCPLHKWSWNLQGEMQGAPHFGTNPCMHLRTWSLENWR